MDHLTRCILFVLCSVPLSLGIGTTLIGLRREAKAQKISGILIAALSALASLYFGIGMLRLKGLPYLFAGILIACPLGVVAAALHNALDKSAANGFSRGMSRVLLTILHLAVWLGSMQLVGHDHMALGILVSIDAAVVLCLYWVFWRNARAKKLASSPVMRRVVKLCREYKCVAVQLCPDRVRLFDHLPDQGFCKSELHYVPSQPFVPPALWAPWFAEGAWCQELKFADAEYPSMTQEQLELCAQGLKKKLKGFVSCHHHCTHRSSSYTDTRDANDHIVTTKTTYITHLYDDQLLYKKSALSSLQKNPENKKQRRKKQAQSAAAKQNSWE